MRNGGLSGFRRRAALRAACFFVAALALGLAGCNDLGGPIQWATYTVVYHAQDGSGRTETHTHRYGDTWRLLDGFDRTGHAFLGWARQPGGTPEFLLCVCECAHKYAREYGAPACGRRYPEYRRRLAGRVGETIDLFAIWQPFTITVIYCPNGGVGERIEQTYTFADGNTLRRNTFTSMGMGGQPAFFGGWARSPTGMPEFADGDYLRYLPLYDGGTVTLYAWWSDSEYFALTFHFNGGTGETGESYRLSLRAGSFTWLPNHEGLSGFSRTGYQFVGWNARADYAGIDFRAGDRFIPTEDITLYAQWFPVGASFTVTFDGGGAGGPHPPPRQVSLGGEGTPLPGAGDLSMPGHEFVGWSDRPVGIGAIFPQGFLFEPMGNLTLYARWEPESPGGIPNVSWTATVSGAPYTTAIHLSFDEPISGLAPGDIRLIPGTGGATAGTLTGGGTSWTLNVSNPVAGSLVVWIERSGITSRPITLTVSGPAPPPGPPITWTAIAVGAPSTTAIHFFFTAPVDNLTLGDITVGGGTGSITLGALTGGGTSWSLAVQSVVTPGYVSVLINRDGIASGPQTVTIVDDYVPVPDIPWVAIASGNPTNAINFVFGAPVGEFNLTAGDIQIGGSPGLITTGALTNNGMSRSLVVTGVTTPGDITVSITRSGIAPGPQTVTILNDPPPDTSGNFSISFADFHDAAPHIIGPTFSLLGPPGTITVLNPGQFHSIEWLQGGTPVATGTVSGYYDETLTLDWRIHGNRPGPHFVTVIVRVNRNGTQVPYSRIVRFNVEL